MPLSIHSSVSVLFLSPVRHPIILIIINDRTMLASSSRRHAISAAILSVNHLHGAVGRSSSSAKLRLAAGPHHHRRMSSSSKLASFATIDPEEVSGVTPYQVYNFGESTVCHDASYVDVCNNGQMGKLLKHHIHHQVSSISDLPPPLSLLSL